MISLKKHIDGAPDGLKSAYQSSLAAMSRAASRAVPQVPVSLQPNLETGRVVAALDEWGERAADHFRQKAAEVKEILLLVTGAAQSAGDKDERYAAQLSAFSGRLNDIATLDDLTLVRQSLAESSAGLKTCAARMAEDGRAIVSKLQSEVATYQARLQDAERQASLDPLTGLANRRGIETDLADRSVKLRAFSVILLDLNHFKKVNDAHGHQAGDELLQQFASELKSRFRSVDTPGRWGGDEFLVVFDGPAEQARAAVGKASEWLFGDYRLKSAKVHLTASTGIAQWNGSETFAETIQRADADMYSKKDARSTA